MNSINTNQNTNQSSSLALDLETLNSTYKNLLTKYKQAVLDYIDNLNAQASKPCGKYSADSKGIDQKCYDEIWKKAGCTTTDQVKADNSWAKTQTLNELIYDSFLWATMTDDTHRKGCYGKSKDSPYNIIGVGADGKLYKCENLELIWKVINDGFDKKITSICTGNDGKMIIVTTEDKKIFYKPSFDTLKWTEMVDSCCVTSIAMGQDGSLIGVGTDKKLYTKSGFNEKWVKTTSPEENITAICIAPDGSILSVYNESNRYNEDCIYKKDSYKNLSSQSWKFQSNNNLFMKAITIATDDTIIGVEKGNRLISKSNYKRLTSESWKKYNSSLQVVGVTTITNPNYSGPIFTTATKPNYNINTPILTEVKGQAFWGTSGVGENVSKSLQECSASCSNTPNCTGATFNSDKQYCWLRGGEGSPIPARADDYAIVPKSTQLLKIVESLNNEINVVNRKMQKRIDEVYGVYGKQIQQRDVQKYSLIDQYENLNGEREKINNMIKEYQTLEATQNEMGIYITKNYYLFFIFFGIVFIAVIALAMLSVDQATTSAVAFAIVNPAVTAAKSVANNVNPFYVMFGIILLVVISYLYNQYITSIYNNVPSFKNMGQLGIIYVVFIIVIIFVAISYFTKK